MVRRYDEVITESRKALELFPGFRHAHLRLAWALWRKGDYETALVEFRTIPYRNPRIAEAIERGLDEDGARGAERAVAKALETQSESRYVDPLTIALRYARAGDIDLAIGWLEKALDNRSPLLFTLGGDPDYEDLLSDPRVVELLGQMGLPD